MIKRQYLLQLKAFHSCYNIVWLVDPQKPLQFSSGNTPTFHLEGQGCNEVKVCAENWLSYRKRDERQSPSHKPWGCNGGNFYLHTQSSFIGWILLPALNAQSNNMGCYGDYHRCPMIFISIWMMIMKLRLSFNVRTSVKFCLCNHIRNIVSSVTLGQFSYTAGKEKYVYL